MALNKVLLLNEVQLLKLIQDNGYEDVANILENRHIDGKTFLELSDFQTLAWKLPPAQLKILFNFIRRVKNDPSVILKQKPVTNITTANKPKPNVSATLKPKTFIPKPAFTQTSPQEKALIKKISLNNFQEKNELKQKLVDIFNKNNTQSIKPSLKDTSNKCILPKLSPIEITKPKPLPPEPASAAEPNQINAKHKAFLPEPDSADETNQWNAKLKAFLPEPIERSNSSAMVKNKIQPVINKRLPSRQGLTCADMDNTDEDYLTPNDLGDNYIEPENTYELPPNINKRVHVLENNRKFYPEKPKEVANRSPIPIPRKSYQNDEEINDYETIPVENHIKLRSNIKTIGGYLDLESGETEENLANSITESTQRSIKLTAEDPNNVIIVERDESKRPANFLDKLNSFFAVKSKPTKQDDSFKVPLNYENHMLQSEIPSIEILDGKPYKNRPLPEIPFNLPTTSSSSLRNSEMISTRNNNPVLSTGYRSLRKKSNIELPRFAETNVKVTEKIHNRNQFDTMESKKEETRTRDNDVDDIAKYENQQFIRTSTFSSQKKSVSPILISPDALKSREINLKQKSLINNKSLEDPSSKRYHPPFYGNVAASQSSASSYLRKEINLKAEDEEVSKEEVLLREDEQDSIFNINNEKFYRNTDRKGAKKLLCNLEDGAFLFRPSRKYFLVLTLKKNGKYYNLGIERTNTNKIRLNSDSSSVSPEFGTLTAFVDYFKREALTFKEGGIVIQICLKSSLLADVF
ncbi:unnamed protein product [Psylliodes chrysocephalus]|uniref:SH2 domain-containing protein n=1 Tax=Psylliodes chrysocephalus TaxID=3402493 RepID=A0A9P0CUE4_9CUCU|nr:unnamed protein product [Psylliodes chrysocephala]